MLRRLIIPAALLALVVVGTAGALRSSWLSPLPVPQGGALIEVEPGMPLRRLTRRLDEQGIIDQPLLFNAVARATGADQRLRPGEYRVAAGTTAGELLQLLQSGRTVRYLVTLPEGIRLSEALDILHGSEGLRAELAGADDGRLRALLDGLPSTEGFFLPETYQYERGDSDFDVLRSAHGLAREALAKAWSSRDPALPYASPYEVLIMASIIEKETGVPEERRQIAGVFVRRLERGMRLQTDPTVIYGLGETFDGNLTRAQLRDEANPYNTYRHRGLPPSPIALPGRAAIDAATQPTAGDALYFVARGDGTHAFSATLEEHREAVRAFQLRRRDDYRSSPGAERDP